MLLQKEFDLTVKRIIVVQKSQRKAKSRLCDDIVFLFTKIKFELKAQ